jgi:hypothetical protein
MGSRTFIALMVGMRNGRSILPATAGMPVCDRRRLMRRTMTDNEKIADKDDQQQKRLSLYRLETDHEWYQR